MKDTDVRYDELDNDLAVEERKQVRMVVVVWGTVASRRLE